MWIFENDAFLSIIQPLPGEGGAGNKLLVRGRIKGDIERVFPGVRVTVTPTRDYRFRALIDRDEVARVVSKQIQEITYTNFKGSVSDRDRYDAYMGVWSVMYREQMRHACGRSTPLRP